MGKITFLRRLVLFDSSDSLLYYLIKEILWHIEQAMPSCLDSWTKILIK